VSEFDFVASYLLPELKGANRLVGVKELVDFHVNEQVDGIADLTVKPRVEYYMSVLLPSVTMNRYKAVRLDDDYGLFVWDSEAGEYRPREVFSGGTEDQLLLVMRLAFALALTPETKGTRPEFLFLDEPLGSSDEIRRGEIVQLLKIELAQYFKQVLLVSHVEGLEQDVDHIVRLDAGRIVEET